MVAVGRHGETTALIEETEHAEPAAVMDPAETSAVGAERWVSVFSSDGRTSCAMREVIEIKTT